MSDYIPRLPLQQAADRLGITRQRLMQILDRFEIVRDHGRRISVSIKSLEAYEARKESKQ